MPFEISISTGGSSPIYRQIADQIRVAVATGTLEEGEQLPSVRNLAERLVINPNTVTRAYGELVREGVLRSHQGRGLFVEGSRSVYTKTERVRRLQPAVEALVNAGVGLGFSAKEILGEVSRRLARLDGKARKARRGTGGESNG